MTKQPEPDWDPRSEPALSNQIAVYDAMRQRCPVARSQYGYTSLFRHDDVMRVLNDPEVFSNAVSRYPSVPNGMDPPQHTEFRRVIEPYFSAKRMDDFEPACREIVVDLTKNLPVDGECEMIGVFAQSFAVRAQCDFLGWPVDMRESLRQWIRKNHAATLARDAAALSAVALEFDGHVKDLLAMRRKAGAAAPCDITTSLMHAKAFGRPIAENEIVSILRNWTVGELGTISASVGILAHYLAVNPAIQDQLREHSDLLPAAIDEILRIRAPLKALELTPANLAFLSELVRKLVTPENRPLTVAEDEQIDSGLRALGQLQQQERSFGALRAFLGQQDREGIGARLERWCRGGPMGWVLDGEQDELGLDARFIGFDMTDLLDHPAVRTPLMMYLFHRVERLIDGRRLIIDIDEFWKALGDDAFRDLANNKLKTIRKQNGVMVFGTQSPRDALASPIAHTIVEQCPTQIFLPNARGTKADYVDGFHLTDTEFRLIKDELTPESRRFLVKQGHNSVVAELNLDGFGDALAVLSGRTETVELLDRIRAEVGDDPAIWLPVFHAERKVTR